jgi:hypothetical protein
LTQLDGIPTPQRNAAPRVPATCAADESAAGALRAAGRSIQRDSRTCRPLRKGINPGKQIHVREPEPAASTGRQPRINACAVPRGQIHAHTISIAKGLARRPGAYRRCFRDPAEEKKQPRNSLLSDRRQKANSRRPQGMRRILPADRGVKRARTQTAACEQQHRRSNTPPQVLL